MRAQVLHFKGVRILHLDFSNCPIAEAPQAIEDCRQLVHAQPKGSAFTLTDFTGTTFNSELTTLLRNYTKANAPFVRFAAVVGVTGIKRAIYRAVLLFSGRSNIVLCDSVEQAREALVAAAEGRAPSNAA